MTPINKIIKSLSATCEECGAEVVFTPIYSPPFRELSPCCPFCQFPMTKEQSAEEMLKARQEVTARLIKIYEENAA